jgi:hypothetical protein
MAIYNAETQRRRGKAEKPINKLFSSIFTPLRLCVSALKFAFLLLALLSFGCENNQSAVAPAPTNENRAASTNTNAEKKPELLPKNPQTPFERALFSIRVEDFEQVLVFRRKDGGAFTEEDKDFLRKNQEQNVDRRVNRWIACDDGKCFIAGTNFEFSRENLVALQNRFDIKDYSKSNEPAELVLPPAAESK